MFKIRIVVVFVFISAISFAQIMKVEKNALFKGDSLRPKIDFSTPNNPEIAKLFKNKKSKEKYFIPNSYPKNDSIYAALKGKKRDDSIYNTPNVIEKKFDFAKK